MTPYYTVMHDFGIMHDKSWGIGLVLFAMTKSCHFSQSTCRSLRLMSFQEKQEQGYTFSIHNIFTCSKVKGVKMPRAAKENAEIEFSVPETFRICELYQEENVFWNQGSPEYFKTDKMDGALERMKRNWKKNPQALLNLYILSSSIFFSQI